MNRLEGNFFKDSSKALRRFDRSVIRPTVRAVMGGVAFLDKTVPGWTVLASVLTPALPFMPLVTAALQAASAAGSIVGGVSAIATGSVSGLIPGLTNVEGVQRVVELPLDLQRQLADVVQTAAREWGQKGVEALEPVKVTLSRAIARYVEERGPLAQHVEALAVEVVQGAALCAAVALTVLTAGAGGAAIGGVVQGAGVAVTAGGATTFTAGTSVGITAAQVIVIESLSVALTAAQEGYRVAQTYELAKAVKKVARAQRDAALAEQGRLEREEGALRAEIEAIRAQRAALAAGYAAEPVPAAEDVLAQDDTATTVGKGVAFALGLLALGEVLA